MGAVTPHLVVNGASGAIDFYVRAFGAEEVQRVPTEDGRLMHAAITINGDTVMLMDDFPEARDGQRNDPQAIGGTPVLLHLEVPDVDAAWQRALDAGAKVTMPLEDQFWGERYGQLVDPFGHVWSLASPTKS
ncbi:VOC family protein [Spiractinospora alimapuensis]|nr:VOC family protein [Spiractinospora alimapuensis]